MNPQVPRRGTRPPTENSPDGQIKLRRGVANLALRISCKLFPDKIGAVKLVKKLIDRINTSRPRTTVSSFPLLDDEFEKPLRGHPEPFTVVEWDDCQEQSA